MNMHERKGLKTNLYFLAQTAIFIIFEADFVQFW